MKIDEQPTNRHQRRAEAARARQKKPPKPLDLTSPFLDSDQFATLCHTSRRSVERWRREGNGPPFLVVNGRRLYDTAVVLEWMRSRQVMSTSAA
jgi:hypothetical protein